MCELRCSLQKEMETYHNLALKRSVKEEDATRESTSTKRSLGRDLTTGRRCDRRRFVNLPLPLILTVFIFLLLLLIDDDLQFVSLLAMAENQFTITPIFQSIQDSDRNAQTESDIIVCVWNSKYLQLRMINNHNLTVLTMKLRHSRMVIEDFRRFRIPYCQL